MNGMKKYLAESSAAVMAACLLLTGCGAENTETASVHKETVVFAAAEEEPEEIDPRQAAAESSVPRKKEEMISVQADSAGTPEKIEVSGILSGFTEEDGAYLADLSGLADLKNTTGEEEFCTAEDGTVYWQNLGSDIHYEGVSETELPVGVTVTYYLNGEEMPLSDIKGKSGDVRIRFDYEVRESSVVSVHGEPREMTVPFLALSMVTLPEDIFSDVEISHGKVMTLGGQKAAVGYALPGLEEDLALSEYKGMEDVKLPSFVEISAKTDSFELDFTATVLKAGLFRDLNEERLDSFDEDIRDIDELENAVNDMEEAAGKLTEGAAELQNYLLQYANGVNQVAAAVSAMNQGLAGYDLTSMSQMADQLQQTAGLSELSGSLQQTAQLSQLAEPLRQLGNLSQALSQTAQLADLAGQIETMAAASPESPELQALAAWAEPLRSYAGLAGWAESVQGISGYADSLAGLSALSDAAAGMSQLTAFSQASSSVAQMQGGLQDLQNGLAQLTQGTAGLPAAGQALYDGMTELVNGTAEFRDGITEFKEEGVREMTEFFREDLGGLIGKIRGLRETDLRYKGYTPSYDEQEVDVSFLIETEGTE